MGVFLIYFLGIMYTWGAGEQGQLGRRVLSRFETVQSLFAREVRPTPRGRFPRVYAGAYHSFAIGDHGEVYTAGLNNHGQLGLEDTENRGSFTLLNGPWSKGIKSMDGGEHFSALLDETGIEFIIDVFIYKSLLLLEIMTIY